MFKKILIANRGDVAAGILKSCRGLGIKTVSIFSEPDWNSLHVKIADQAFCVGKGPVTDSYLNYDAIMEIARKTGADAVHPGWGFLAENYEFALACEKAGLAFIGPEPEILSKMVYKLNAKKAASKAGIPIVPGTELLTDTAQITEFAKNHGYPLLLKADCGQGGRLIRKINSSSEIQAAYSNVKRESEKADLSSGIFVEKYIENAYHIEFQILADGQGGVLVFPEMNCSLQRRFQKLLEESPATVISETMRKKLIDMTIDLARKFNFRGAAGIEFLVDTSNNIYFLEVNPRLAVERAVAEVLTGIDILENQILLSSGTVKTIDTRVLKPHSSAMECHINAEDPEKGFIPVPGKINVFSAPGGTGIRVDTSVFAGCTIPIYYDSNIAKVIAVGGDRQHVIRRMRSALDQFLVKGVDTTISFFKNLLSNEYFIEDQVPTDFSKHELFMSLCRVRNISDETAAIAAALDIHFRQKDHRPHKMGYRAGKTENAWGASHRNMIMKSRGL
jgi:acetyl-CoA carboxylase biotin carboxylase subunit